MRIDLPKKVSIMEVGPRDGLQNEKTIVDTPTKIAFIEQLVEAGVQRIEVTAFVSPQWIPPLADQMEVARGVTRAAGVSYAALVPNMRGYERAIESGVTEVAFVIAASDTHNRKNINASTEEAFGRYKEIAKQTKKDNIPFRVYLSCSFGCPYEGNVEESVVATMAHELLQLGAYEISIGDTIGIGNPLQTHSLLGEIQKKVHLSKIALHMHDTRGLALANIFVALSMGVSSFDSSAGGLGGCPYAPGASGNVATEDLIYMLDSMGIESGININKLCQVSARMEKVLRHTLPAKLLAVCKA